MFSSQITTGMFFACYRYSAENVRYCNVSFASSLEIPDWLQKRPTAFIEHCTKRLPGVSHISSSHVVELDDGLFHVFTPTSGKHYEVALNPQLNCALAPRCECVDWFRTGYPCKHIIAVVTLHAGSGWDSLPDDYKNSWLFRIDVPGYTMANTLHCTIVDSDSVTDEATDDNYTHAPQLPTQDSTQPVGEPTPSNVDCLQQMVRDKLRILLNQTYNIDSPDILNDCLSKIDSLFPSLAEGIQHSAFGNFPMQSRRRVAHSFAKRTALLKRLNSIRAKRRNKRKSTRKKMRSNGKCPSFEPSNQNPQPYIYIYVTDHCSQFTPVLNIQSTLILFIPVQLWSLSLLMRVTLRVMLKTVMLMVYRSNNVPNCTTP